MNLSKKEDRKIISILVERVKDKPWQKSKIKCRKNRDNFPSKPCTESACDYYISFPLYLNCSYVASTIKPHTLEEIGEMTGLTRERIRQIEEKATNKLSSLSKRKILKDFIPAGAQKILMLKRDEDARITIREFCRIIGQGRFANTD